MDFRAFRNNQPISATTVNIEHRHLKAIFNWGIAHGYFKTNPFNGMKQIKVPESKLPRFFEKDEIKEVRKIFKGGPIPPPPGGGTRGAPPPPATPQPHQAQARVGKRASRSSAGAPAKPRKGIGWRAVAMLVFASRLEG